MGEKKYDVFINLFIKLAHQHFREDNSAWEPVHQSLPIKVYPQPNTQTFPGYAL